jgi:peptidoglycan/LPS O-acetylase OafA/YrhL
VAVGSVLLFHLWPQRLTGGFVGVDVFFVISGYLITSHLMGELEARGRIRLGRFWARRAKRLLPASLLVLLSVAIATMTLVPLSRRTDVFEELVGATFYGENWVLAGKSVDYLSAQEPPSPVQHFWTLSVEEQFYVALPLVLLVAALVAARARWNARRTVTVVLVVVTLASLAYSIHLSTAVPGAAYFSTGTRAWEFV